jgi:membrane protein
MVDACRRHPQRTVERFVRGHLDPGGVELGLGDPLHPAVWLRRAAQRALLALSSIGLGLIISTVISSYVTGAATETHLGPVGRLAGYLIAVVLDVGLFIAAFRLLTDRQVSTRDVLPGALLSGIVFWLLQ